MEAPPVNGLKMRGPVGHGECGRVYAAEGEHGEKVVVKVFQGMAIGRSVLARMTERLERGGWPAGVMRVLRTDFEARPCWWVTDLLADEDGEGNLTPRSLQHSWEDHPGESSWEVVQSLARGMAGMHRRHVAHGNLKPGNVFFGNDGEVLLADWGLGNMPGVGQLGFTDAVLYQPPEQLRHPEGYLEDAGYRWDVFAFGVLAFRLLTGRFPRCNDTFQMVAPEPGTTRRDGIQADLGRIATNLEINPEVDWEGEPANELERCLREWIDRCLLLDPAGRPASMMEVAAGFEAVHAGLAAAAEREALLDQCGKADRRSSRAFFAAGVAVAVALVLGALWWLTASGMRSDLEESVAEIHSLREKAASAAEVETAANQRADDAVREMEYERERSLARLEGSRLIGDRVFEWAMEKGHRRLPPLDGRELRLQRLDRYFTEFLERTEGAEALEDERARVRLQMAEISLAAGDAAEAKRRLSEAVGLWAERPMEPALKFRIATNSLLLALLHQSDGSSEAGAAFAAAREAFGDVPGEAVDGDLLGQRLAVLDFHEAKLLAANGEDARALDQLLRATQTLNRLVDQRPDAVILRSELAGCYLSSATILDGIGRLGDAREVRSLAVAEIIGLLEKSPGDPRLRFELAGCHGAMAEAAVLSGDIAAAASHSQTAMEILDGLLAEEPENVEAVARKAAQLGIGAGILRDRGQMAEAMKGFDEGIRLLEGVRASAPGDATIAFRLALLWWQKGRMLGMSGDREEEIALLRRAGDLLEKLESERSPQGPRPEVLQSSGAYLLGDLGHALQLANRKTDAGKAFSDAVKLWESLASSRPQSEEYDEGLAWCRQRLKELQ